jgi:hypothetical protein
VTISYQSNESGMSKILLEPANTIFFNSLEDSAADHLIEGFRKLVLGLGEVALLEKATLRHFITSVVVDRGQLGLAPSPQQTRAFCLPSQSMPKKASGGVRSRMVSSTEDEACFQSPLRAACENCYWFYRHRWRRDMRRRERVDASVGNSTRPWQLVH